MAGSLKVFDGVAWQYVQLPQGGAIVQPGQPSAPTVGQLWFDTDDTISGDVSDTGWIDATALLVNAWVNYSTPTYAGARYRRKNGIVYVQGLVKSGTLNAAGGAFTLPVGFRPTAQLLFASVEGTNGHGRLDVLSSGVVQPVSGSNGFFSLNCYFPADA